MAKVERESSILHANFVRGKRAISWYGSAILQRLFGPPGQALLGTITHVVTRHNVAALTFDDGPHPDYTVRLLDILERHHARGTFFMLGEAVQKYPEIVRRVAQGGHAIGNHSWDHPSFPLISSRERRRQMRAWERAASPYASRIFRPPYGEQSLASRLDALWLRYEVIAWNVDVGDWWDRDAQRMANLLVNRVKPGSVITLHDVLHQRTDADKRPKLTREPCSDREPMLAAVSSFLEQTANQYRFVTVPELLQYGRPKRENWYRITPAS
jgi:peptidoglycan-N-acetylglucosamine deacetylase